MRRDVARAAGIGVIPPGSADLLALFENEEGIHAGLAKLDRHAQARKAGADNQNVDRFARRAVLVLPAGCHGSTFTSKTPVATSPARFICTKMRYAPGFGNP